MNKKGDELALAERIFQDEVSRERRFNIVYVVPHSRRDEGHETIFLAYWHGVLLNSDELQRCLMLPFDVRELKASRKGIVFARVMGMISPTIMPITIESLVENPTAMSVYPFRVMVSNDNTYEEVSRFLEGQAGQWLHVSTSSKATDEEKNTTPGRFEAYVIGRIGHLSTKSKVSSAFVEAVLEVMEPARPPRKRMQFPGFAHGITRSNELAAQALGLEVFLEKALRPEISEQYVPAVIKSCKAILGLRRKLYPKAYVRNHLCIAAEPIIWRLYAADVDKDMFAGVDDERQVVLAALAFIKMIRKAEGYVKTLDDKSGAFTEYVKNAGLASAVVHMYDSEMQLFNTNLAVMHACTLTPVLRLSPVINKVRGDLINLAKCARGNNPHVAFKMAKLTVGLQDKMRSLVGMHYLKFLESELHEFAGVSLVSDVPLEWLPLRGLPLALRCDVSRAPATPGNLLLMVSHRPQYVDVAISDFDEILVVRSFSNTDKLRGVLEAALRLMSESDPNYPRYRIVDVKSVDEFLDAVNGYHGALMIFDGHGTLDDRSAVGSIIVGGVAVDVWEYREQLKLPPIVLLSACDTLPIDGGHGSTANGLLALGAVTVLGTLLPVNAARSASFIARLLLRIAYYLPLMVNNFSHMPWRSFLSGMLRMTFCNEMVDAIIKETGLLKAEDLPDIQFVANQAINSMSPDWYEQIIAEIVKRSGCRQKDVIERCRFWGAMVDTLKYVQLGRPDLIRLRRWTAQEAVVKIAESKGLSLAQVLEMQTS